MGDGVLPFVASDSVQAEPWDVRPVSCVIKLHASLASLSSLVSLCRRHHLQGMPNDVVPKAESRDKEFPCACEK